MDEFVFIPPENCTYTIKSITFVYDEGKTKFIFDFETEDD